VNFHKQLFHHDPDNGIFGDCYRTCLANLFGMTPEEVPHFYRGREYDLEVAEAKEWLVARGFRLARVLFDGSARPQDVLYLFGANNLGLFYLFSGRSRTGCNHVVIARDDAIVHDPSLTDAGIIGPMSHGYYEIELLTPENGMASHALRVAEACAE
jgi:hypothetical protein